MGEDTEAVLSVQRLKPGGADAFRERFDRTAAEKADMYDQLRSEGIHVEAVYLEERADGDYLLYYIEADDYDRMVEEFKTSEEAWARDYRSFLEEHVVGGVEAYHETRPECIFHVDVPPAE